MAHSTKNSETASSKAFQFCLSPKTEGGASKVQTGNFCIMAANSSLAVNPSSQATSLDQFWASNQARSEYANWRTNGRIARSATVGRDPKSHVPVKRSSRSNKNRAALARSSAGLWSGYRVAYFVWSSAVLKGPSFVSIRLQPSRGISKRLSGSLCSSAQTIMSRLSSITRSARRRQGTLAEGEVLRNSSGLSRRRISRSSTATPARRSASRARMA